MASDFITVARFNNPAQADRAKARLEAAGIRALLVEHESGRPNWHVEKDKSVLNLLIAPHDEDRAVELLNRPDTDLQNSEAIATERLEGNPVEPAESPSPDLVTSREMLVDRAFKAQIISIIFWPLQLYALYCIIMVARAPQPLREASRRRYVATIVIHCAWWVIVIPFGVFLRLPRL